MFLFAAAGGLHEPLLSPILTRCPSRRSVRPRGSMSMLHSFSPGVIFVVLATTGLLAVGRCALAMDRGRRRFVAGAVLFCQRAAGPRKTAAPRSCRCGRWPGVFYALLAATCQGAAEVTMHQRASAFGKGPA